MKRSFGIGYTERNRVKPLASCIQDERDYHFFEQCLKSLLTTLNQSSANVSYLTIFLLSPFSSLTLYSVQHSLYGVYTFPSPGDGNPMPYFPAFDPKELEIHRPSRVRPISRDDPNRPGPNLPARIWNPTSAVFDPNHSLSHRGKISSRHLRMYGLSACGECSDSRGGQGGNCFV